MSSLLAAAALVVAYQTPRIQDYVQTGFKDATFVAKIVKGDQRELKKINDDFGQAYRFESVKVQAKEPFMLRLESVVDDTSILYVIDGPMLLIRIPKAGIRSKQNLIRSPGRRQTFLDFGLVTPSLFQDFFTANFVRMDRASGDAVFDLTYTDKTTLDTSRHRIWIDTERKIVNKREWYDQTGKPLATFLYEKPIQANGVWMPTQLTVKNNDNKVAGITRYSTLKANAGLPDSLFDVK